MLSEKDRDINLSVNMMLAILNLEREILSFHNVLGQKRTSNKTHERNQRGKRKQGKGNAICAFLPLDSPLATSLLRRLGPRYS